jgi:hypothetical protein
LTRVHADGLGDSGKNLEGLEIISGLERRR